MVRSLHKFDHRYRGMLLLWPCDTTGELFWPLHVRWLVQNFDTKNATVCRLATGKPWWRLMTRRARVKQSSILWVTHGVKKLRAINDTFLSPTTNMMDKHPYRGGYRSKLQIVNRTNSFSHQWSLGVSPPMHLRARCKSCHNSRSKPKMKHYKETRPSQWTEYISTKTSLLLMAT